MQIKRFEAADMTEALRMVKRDFGDEAVILSAKEIRPGGFFSALKKKHVVITAATDYQAKAQQSASAFSDHFAEALDDENDDRVSLSGQADTLGPQAFMDDGDLWPPVDERRATKTQPDDNRRRHEATSPVSAFRRYGRGGTPVSDTDAGIFNNGRHSDGQSTTRPIAEPFFRQTVDGGPQRIALVGPSAAGKSTAIAKLAMQCQALEKKRTGLISLDRFRMGANGLLENTAKIMNLDVVVVRESDALARTLEEMADHDVILVDTPGLAPEDETILADVGQMLATVQADETHLVLNATVREQFLTQALDTFAPLGIDRLLLTHLDAFGSVAEMDDILRQFRLPAAFYGTGVDLFDGLQILTDLSQDSDQTTPRHAASAPTASHTPRIDNAAMGEKHSPIDLNRVKYVANRNSELFHHPTCKSVRRINAENIAAFNSIEQAMEEGFKPCRACCSVSTAKKTAFHAFGFQRASAL